MPRWGSYNPAEWGWPVGDQADIVRFTYFGHDFPGGIARLAAPIFTLALDRIHEQTWWEIPPSLGLDAGMWGYENRRVSGSSSWSFHAFGLAVDVAAPWNPSGASSGTAPYALPDGTGELVQDLGIEWGGDWDGGSLDRMHLELHLTPGEAAAFTTPGGGGGGGQPFPLPAGWYYGWYSGPQASVSGSGRNDGPYRDGIAAAQAVLNVEPDGYYGPVTNEAVRRYQAAHGLVVDGLIGAHTWASLFG